MGLSEVRSEVTPPVAPRAKKKNIPAKSLGCKSFAMAFSSWPTQSKTHSLSLLSSNESESKYILCLLFFSYQIFGETNAKTQVCTIAAHCKKHHCLSCKLPSEQDSYICLKRKAIYIRIYVYHISRVTPVDKPIGKVQRLDNLDERPEQGPYCIGC